MKKDLHGIFDKSLRKDSSRRWVVFITACMSMMLDIGFMFSFGTLYVNIMTTFAISRSEAAMVQSILMAVRFGTGMISGTIVQRFGTQKAGILGSCIATFGLVMSFFASSVLLLDISVGVILDESHGVSHFRSFGSSCLYIASSTAIAQQFAGEKRHILLSIQSAAGGIGGMVFSFFLKYLSDQFGLKGTLLLVGGVYMQILPATFLWRRSENTALGHVPREGTTYCTNTAKVAQNDTDVDSLLSKSGNTYMAHKNEFSIHVDNDNGGNAVLHLTNADNSNKIHSKLIAETNISVSLTRPYDVRLISRKDIGITLKSKNIRRESIGKYLKDLALNPSFVLFAIGLAIVYPALGILFIFIVDLFLDSGLSEEDATFGLLLVHMFSIFGRLLPGIVMQSKHIPSLSVPICAAVVLSACMTGLVTVTGLRLHLLLLGLIGIPYGVFVSVFSVTTLKIVGIDGLSSAVGVHFTLNGIGSALAGPISGSLRDKTGSYTYPFGIASGVILVGAMFFTCSLLIRRKSNRVLHVSERTPLLQDAH